MSSTVFISHSFKDEKIVDTITKEIEKLELKCFLAEKNAQYGKSLPDKVKKAIDTSILVVVILTKDSHSSSSVNQEIGYATSAKKPIIPLVEKGILPSLFLQGLEYVEFEREKLDEIIQRITDFIREKFKKQFTNEWILFLLVAIAIIGMVFAVRYGAK